MTNYDLIKRREIAFMQEIAKHMAGWRLKPFFGIDLTLRTTDVHERTYLSGPEGGKLWLSLKHETGKGERVSVHGDWTIGNMCRSRPSELAGEVVEISMAATKSEAEMAKEIKRRLLPGYYKVLAWAQEQAAREKKYEADKMATAKRFAEAFNGEYRQNQHRSEWGFYNINTDGCYIYNIQPSSNSITFEVRSCNVGLAVEIAKAIKQWNALAKKKAEQP